MKNKTALVLGGGGFIGGHLANRLKSEGIWVRIVDLKERNEFWQTEKICDEYIVGDLRDTALTAQVMLAPNQKDIYDTENAFDEVYQLAADMGGAGYLFTGENDANVMHNSGMINLNVANEAAKTAVKRLFYSSSACIYPEHNQLDPNNPNCIESSVYPANPDSEYGWEKLFSERIYASFQRNYDLDVRIARFHNVFGPKGTWQGGKEKVPAALCRKVAESNYSVEVWGDGQQTRSFLFIEDCIEAVIRFMRQDHFAGPVNIGSEELISINNLAELIIRLSGKKITIDNLEGAAFEKQYGTSCPVGVRGRNSNNDLYKEKMNWTPSRTLKEGLAVTFNWIKEQQEKTIVLEN